MAHAVMAPIQPDRNLVFESFVKRPESIVNFTRSDATISLIESFFERMNSESPSDLIYYVPHLAAATAVCEDEQLGQRLQTVYSSLMPAVGLTIQAARMPARAYEMVVNGIFDHVHEAQFKIGHQPVSLFFNTTANRVSNSSLRFQTATRSNEVIDFAVEQLDRALGERFMCIVFPPKLTSNDFPRPAPCPPCVPVRALSKKLIVSGRAGTLAGKLAAALG